MTVVNEAVSKLKSRLSVLATETAQIRRAIELLEAATNDVKKRKVDARSLPRRRRVRYKVTCTRCEKQFFVHRDPKGKPTFCHKPCTSSQYIKERKAKKKYLKVKHEKGTTIVPGDTITAAPTTYGH